MSIQLSQYKVAKEILGIRSINHQVFTVSTHKKHQHHHHGTILTFLYLHTNMVHISRSEADPPNNELRKESRQALNKRLNASLD